MLFFKYIPFINKKAKIKNLSKGQETIFNFVVEWQQEQT